MAAEHTPPPGGGGGREPVPGAGAASGEAAVVVGAPLPTGHPTVSRPAARGASGSTARGSRLLPSGPALEHAPLLLGLDAAGGEHPQGAEYPDDEDLVGRVWGCLCGWRGTVRDVSTRPFHPRVGDGGGLRRQRLSRSDRDTRTELEAHLARNPSTPADRAATVSPASAPSIPATSITGEASQERGDARPRGRRRRLTVPRDSPLAIPAPTAPPALRAASEPAVDDEPEVSLVEPTLPLAAPTSPGPDVLPAQQPHRQDPAGDQISGLGEPSRADLLANAVARAATARLELTAAESALAAAVADALEEGLSWRTIGRATGLDHREAAARWGPGGGPSL